MLPSLTDLTTTLREVNLYASRRMGPVATGARVLLGTSLLVLASIQTTNPLQFGLRVADVLLGWVLFPTIAIALIMAARRRMNERIEFTGAGATAIHTAVLVLVFAHPKTRVAADLFYGASMLLAAWRDLPGCEVTAVPNLLLNRRDSIGCPVFWPVDVLEQRSQQQSFQSDAAT